MPPRYPFPWRTALPLLWDVLHASNRSFQADAYACANLLSPPLKIINPENIPSAGPALLITNHYSRPGFRAWWIALAISSAVPMDVHWLMTDAWTFLGPLTPLSNWALRRVARVYGFTASPPMPPRPKDVEARARVVRRILEISRTSDAVIALAPEGRDFPEGILGSFPPGVGRFIEKLTIHCQPIIPIGVYESNQSLCLNFGSPLGMHQAPKQTAKIRDQAISQRVASALAKQLPPDLRGAYGK